MGNMRILLIAAGLLVAIVALLTLDLSATEFGIIMLGGAAIVAVVMFYLTRRRYQRMTEAEKESRDPPEL
jgi:Flp pilus assembly protein TadB